MTLIPSIAFVTPSYTADLERCELLVESLDRFAPDIRHYLLVDGPEIANFKHLESARTVLVPSEEILDRRLRRLPGNSGVWVSWQTLPVRGWITQQLRKLACPTVVSEEAIVCLDSDTTFIRPFSTGHILEHGKLGLLDVDYTAGLVSRWTAYAASLVGAEPALCSPRGHVGHLVVWSRRHLLALHQCIEEATGIPWQIAIGRKPTISEYILYGTYIRCIVGYDESDHMPSTRPLVRQPWQHDLSTTEGLRNYINDPEPENIAVMIHSKFGISAKDVRPLFENSWASFQDSQPAAAAAA